MGEYVRHELGQFHALKKNLPLMVVGRDPFPHCVEIHPTDFCNQACSYCFHGGVGEDVSRRGEMLSVAEYRDLVDELAGAGVCEVSVSGGGEPMFYLGIGEVLGHIARSPLDLRLVTNANVIPDDAVPALMDAAEVRVSIDSVNSAVYNEQRGMRGGNLLDRTLKNLRMLVTTRERTGGRVRIACTFLVSELNQAEIEQFAAVLIGDVGVDTVVYKQDIYGRITFEDAEVRHRLDRVARDHGDRVEIRVEDIDDEIGGPCGVAYSKVAFNPYGELYSCCLGSQPGEKNGSLFGSLRAAGGFRKLWENSADSRRSMLFDGVSCQDCNHTDRLINVAVRAELDRVSV